MKIYFLPILTVCYLIIGIRGQRNFDTRKAEKKILDDIFNVNGYDSQFRPYGNDSTLMSGGPVKLRVQVLVRSIYEVNDKKSQYKVHLTVRQRWWDDRLQYDSFDGKIEYIRLQSSRIWMPDLFIANELEAETHDIFTPNELVRVFPNGDVLFSIRVTVRLFCKMNFRNFPFDYQWCSLTMPSYGNTINNMMVNWESGDPLQVAKGLPSIPFRLESFATGNCDSKTNTDYVTLVTLQSFESTRLQVYKFGEFLGTYGCLRAKFLFKRSYAYYQLQVYIPTSMLVILSWLSLWIDRELVIARILLALMTLLTMATQIVHFNNNVPSVDYTKALDVWTGMCLTFSFSIIVEFIIVHHMSKRRKSVNLTTNSEDDNTEDFKASKNRSCFNVWPLISTPDGLDIVARIAYPVFFVIFNMIYWPTYAFSSSDAVDGFNRDMTTQIIQYSHQ